MQSASFVTYWYLHLPSLLLAALIVLVFGRLLLTPAGGTMRGVMALAMVWLAALRMGVFWIALAMGVRL